ncbi:MAG TPA: glycosyl hydrolase family 28 protein [Bacteroidota bacterium]|nr:glycosyl hydrolase family 28 protein [Bacteroidota bacterium]
MDIRLVPLTLLAFLCTRAAPAGSAVYVITEFGAAGDGRTLNTAAIQNVIDSSAARGGGTVVVPAGVFVTGTLRLRSNVHLWLQSGAVLKGSTRLGDYTLDGRRVGLLYAEDARNVTITGPGTIDGSGDAFMDLSRAKKIDSAGSAWTRQKSRFREVASGTGDGPAVPLDRPYQMIIFSVCRNVVLRDLVIANSPFWTVHCADCDGVLMSGVRIWCNLLVPNSDGADFTSSSNVLISDCDIRTGDDCLVFTGYSRHHDLPGYRGISHASENINVTNCTMVSRSSAIRIGGFDQNPMRNYTFSNLTIHDSNRGIGIFARDAGSIENLTFANIVIQTRLHTGDWWGNGEPIHLSAVRLTKDVKLGRISNVKFQHIICTGESGILVYGTEENVIDNVSFEDVTLHIAGGPLQAVAGGNFDLRPVLDPGLQLFAHDIPGLYAQYVRNLRIRDFDLSWDRVKQPFFTDGLDIREFDGVSIEGFRGTGSPARKDAFPVSLINGKGLRSPLSGGPIHTENVERQK